MDSSGGSLKPELSPSLPPTALSLRALDDQICLHMPGDASKSAEGGQTTAWIIFIGGALFALAAILLLPSPWKGQLALSGLIVELLGGAYLVLLELRGIKIGKLRQEMAADLDRDYAGQRIIVNWLRSHGEEEISDKLRFVQARIASMTRRLGILLGSVEKLGLVPVIVAVYLQIRAINLELTWPPEIDVMEVLPGLLIVVFYAGGMIGVALRLRLHLYEVLMGEALREPVKPRNE